MASKKYPPGQTPAKPTMAQAFNAAQGPAVNRPTGSSAIGATGMPGKVGPLMGKTNSFPNVASAVKAAVKAISNSRPANPSSAIGATGMPNAKPVAKPTAKPLPPKESADITAQKKTANTTANKARQATDMKYDKVVGKKAAAPAASTGKGYTGDKNIGIPVVGKKATSSASTAKPYTKLKQPAREATRRAYVQKQLDRLGIKPAPAGKPRSAAEKAARVKARATWDKKNKFVPKSSPQSGGSGPMENRPEA